MKQKLSVTPSYVNTLAVATVKYTTTTTATKHSIHSIVSQVRAAVQECVGATAEALHNSAEEPHGRGSVSKRRRGSGVWALQPWKSHPPVKHQAYSALSRVHSISELELQPRKAVPTGIEGNPFEDSGTCPMHEAADQGYLQRLRCVPALQ